MTDLDGSPLMIRHGVADFDFPRENTMGRVESGEIGHRLKIGGLVDGDHLNVLSERRFMQGAKEAAPDTAVAIDRQSYGSVHGDIVFD